MSENPYQSPQTIPSAVGVAGTYRDDLHTIALYQKALIGCIFVCPGSLVATAFVPDAFHTALAILALSTRLLGTVLVVLIATKVYRIGTVILTGILTLVPVVGLFVLLRVNGKATSVLKANGVKVGFFGADLGTI